MFSKNTTILKDCLFFYLQLLVRPSALPSLRDGLVLEEPDDPRLRPRHQRDLEADDVVLTEHEAVHVVLGQLQAGRGCDRGGGIEGLKLLK